MEYSNVRFYDDFGKLTYPVIKEEELNQTVSACELKNNNRKKTSFDILNLKCVACSQV